MALFSGNLSTVSIYWPAGRGENQDSRNKEGVYFDVQTGGDVEAMMLGAARRQKRFTPCSKKILLPRGFQGGRGEWLRMCIKFLCRKTSRKGGTCWSCHSFPQPAGACEQNAILVSSPRRFCCKFLSFSLLLLQ